MLEYISEKIYHLNDSKLRWKSCHSCTSHSILLFSVVLPSIIIIFQLEFRCQPSHKFITEKGEIIVKVRIIELSFSNVTQLLDLFYCLNIITILQRIFAFQPRYKICHRKRKKWVRNNLKRKNDRVVSQGFSSCSTNMKLVTEKRGHLCRKLKEFSFFHVIHHLDLFSSPTEHESYHKEKGGN